MDIEKNADTMRRILREVTEGKRQFDAQTHKELSSLKTNYDVVIKLVSIGGTCPAEHKIGDKWIVRGTEDGWKTPNLCIFAFSAIYPSLQMLMFGGSFPWEPDAEAVLVPCPDSRNDVVFELKRIGK